MMKKEEDEDANEDATTKEEYQKKEEKIRSKEVSAASGREPVYVSRRARIRRWKGLPGRVTLFRWREGSC
jgi:hypothetical protein